MSQERYHRAKEIFLAARRRSQGERLDFVAEACGGDAELRREVESLLAFLDRAFLDGAFLDRAYLDRAHLDRAYLDPAGEADAGRPDDATAPGQPQRIGSYRIVRKLGEGGMGVVYEAAQEGPIRRTVALKVIRAGMDSRRVVARFDAERQALALMTHPNIARALEAGATENGEPYFVMEYVDGLPITDYCDRRRLEIRGRLGLFVELCRGVEHAHRRGIVHRDIKPSNVLVASEDGQRVPKLIDFGVAKALEQPLTEHSLHTELGEWIGTPEYMSPEQAGLGDGEIDARTDVYSLGALLYELLVGARPYDAEALRTGGFEAVRRVLRDEDPVRPSVRLEGIGEAAAEAAAEAAECRGTSPSKLRSSLRELDWIVMTAMAKEPSRRYPSALELAEDVDRYLAAEPVRAAPPSLGYRLRRTARRHRLGLALSAAALSALLAGLALGSLWLRQRPPPPSASQAGSLELADQTAAASVAVLPFVNLSDDPELEYFSDGLSEELLNALARLPELRVAARTSSFAYKDTSEDARAIGEALGVTHLLEGSVRRSGQTLRIVAQLIDADDGLHLWSHTFDRQLADVLAVQEEISAAVAGALEVQLAGPRRGAARAIADPVAYDLFLRGRQLLRERTPGALAEAGELFEEAIGLDPSFASAYVGRAESYLFLARNGDLPMETADRLAMASLERALQLDPELADAHAAVGLLRSIVGDGAGAEASLRRALELNPSLAEAHRRLGNLLVALNRQDEADVAYSRALRLDPLNRQAFHAAAIALIDRGRYDDGMLRFQQWLRVEPDSAETYRLMALSARTYGRLDDAVRWARSAVEHDPEAPLNLHELVMAHSALGEMDQASEWMDRAYRMAPNNHWTLTLRTAILLQAGDLEGLEQLIQQQLALDPRLDPGSDSAAGSDSLPPISRLRLALAARSKVYRGEYPEASVLYERALGVPFSGLLEIGFDADALLHLAYVYRELGREEDAREALAHSLELVNERDDWIWARLVMPGTLAGIHAVAGRHDEAVETLQRAVAEGYSDWWTLQHAPYFEELRQRPDFRALLTGLELRLEPMRRGSRSLSSAASTREAGRADGGR